MTQETPQAHGETEDRVFNAETRRALRRGARRLRSPTQASDDTATGGDSDR